MKEKEFFRLLKAAKARYQKDIDSIEQVWRLANGGPPPTQKPAQVAADFSKAMESVGKIMTRVDNQVRRANIAKIVTEIVPKMDKEFTIHDIAKYLRETRPDIKFKIPYLSSILSRLSHRGIIIMIQGKKGGEAAKYAHL